MNYEIIEKFKKEKERYLAAIEEYKLDPQKVRNDMAELGVEMTFKEIDDLVDIIEGILWMK